MATTWQPRDASPNAPAKVNLVKRAREQYKSAQLNPNPAPSVNTVGHYHVWYENNRGKHETFQGAYTDALRERGRLERKSDSRMNVHVTKCTKAHGTAPVAKAKILGSASARYGRMATASAMLERTRDDS